MKRWLRWAMVAVWMAVIFALSAQPNSNQETENYFGTYNFLVRKAAHMTEYAVLYLLTRFALSAPDAVPASERRRPAATAATAKSNFIALFIVVLYAASDEWHQSFVPGRSAALADVGIDAVGASIAFCLRQAYLSLATKLLPGRRV